MLTALACGPLVFSGACGPSSDDIVRNLQSDNPTVRQDTAKIAKNFGSDEVEGALVASLADPNTQTRINAVQSLVALEATGAVPGLMARLEAESSAEVQKEIVDALGRLGDRQAVPTLMVYLESRRVDPPLNAIWALGNLGDPQAMALLSELRDSPDPYVSYSANVALRELHP